MEGERILMKDIKETDRVNKVMAEALRLTTGEIRLDTLSIEGYSVISDSNQNPHTSVDIYVDRIDFRGYTTIIRLFSDEFVGHYSMDNFIIPDNTQKAHARFILVIQLNKKEESDIHA
jgi:hypothetical protein